MESPQQVSEANSPNSPNHSTYGTPTDESNATKSSEKDAQLVVGAGRSLKNMLVDLMSVLEEQASTKIFIQGDITLCVDGRESYTIKLQNEDNVEPSNLRVRIENAVNDDNVGTSQKRKSSQLEDATETPDSPSKRTKTDDAPPPPAPGNDDDDGAGEPDQPEFDRIMTKFSNISAQIKWVEECRRLAGQAHDAREEKWRSTSATFHDDNRKATERHNMWMTTEMGWQRSMLIQLANDVKGLYPLTHSLKWETPPQLTHAKPPIPMPRAVHTPLTNDGPLGKPYVPKPRKPSTTPANGRKT